MIVTDLPSPVVGLKIGSCGPVLVSCFNDWPNGAILAALSQAQLAHSKTHPRIVSLAIIPVAPLPGSNVSMQQPEAERAAALRQSAALADELKAITAASAMIILSRGLLAVMVRTFMAALGLVSRSGNELKTFRTLEEAEAWLPTVPGVPPIPPGLAAAIAQWLAAGRPA